MRYRVPPEIADEIADLYMSDLFSPVDIAARYGLPHHQTVVAIGFRIENERRNAQALAFRKAHGCLEGRIPEHLQADFYRAIRVRRVCHRLGVDF